MRHLGHQLSNEQWIEFIRSVEEAGINLDPWWEAVEYAGPSKVLRLGLFFKQGWFSKSQIAAGDDQDNLRTLANYISNNWQCKNFKLSIEAGQWYLQRGHFAITQKSAWRGGNKQAIVDLLRSFGIDSKLIDETLSERTETVLGYILSSNAEEANELAKIVQAGAMAPDYEGTYGFIQWLKVRNSGTPRE